MEVEAIDGFGSVSSWREGVQFCYDHHRELPDGDLAGDTAPALRLQIHELTNAVGNRTIEDVLGDRPGVPAAHIRQLIRQQGHGTPGLLRVNRRANIFDFRTPDGGRWFVGIWWSAPSAHSAAGWYMNPVQASDTAGTWPSGSLVISAASESAPEA